MIGVGARQDDRLDRATSAGDNGSDQIVLRLSHAANVNDITAAFDVLSSTGTVLQTVTFVPTGQLFTDGNLFTRAQFFAADPNPTLVAILQLDTLSKFADSPNTKIVIPAESAALLGAAQAIQSVLAQVPGVTAVK